MVPTLGLSLGVASAQQDSLRGELLMWSHGAPKVSDPGNKAHVASFFSDLASIGMQYYLGHSTG